MRDLNDIVHVDLTVADLMELRAGLRASLRSWDAHVAVDDGATHPAAETAEIHRRVGRLIWRLEVAEAAPGSRIQHSAEAVPPDPEPGSSDDPGPGAR